MSSAWTHLIWFLGCCTLLPWSGASAQAWHSGRRETPTQVSRGIEPRFRGDWGYVEVRPGAHLFWLLEPCIECHHTTIFAEPLVIWLQGGPGASGVGYGNFEEIGPYHRGWRPREHSWVRRANVLFIDNPVGTGFSYVEKGGNFTTNNAEIVADLMVFLKEFLWSHREFQYEPVYIFAESYGGKMAAGFAKAIKQATKDNQLTVNLRGVFFGDSWISPSDFVLSWGKFLEAMSLIDENELKMLTKAALHTQHAVANGNLTWATELWGKVEESINNITNGVDFYNVLRHNSGDDAAGSLLLQQLQGLQIPAAAARLLLRHHKESLAKFMDTEVYDLLWPVIPDDVYWGAQAAEVFKQLAGDFMTDVIPVIDDLLASGLSVNIYQGQLDLICCTLGVDAWMAKLKWPGMKAFNEAHHEPMYFGDAFKSANLQGKAGSGNLGALHHSKSDDDESPFGFVKSHKNLAMYVMLNSGHMIPSDRPLAALEMLTQMMANTASSQHTSSSVL